MLERLLQNDALRRLSFVNAVRYFSLIMVLSKKRTSNRHPARTVSTFLTSNIKLTSILYSLYK